MKIIIGALLGWLLGQLDKNKTVDTKTYILIGIIGNYIGSILIHLLFSLISLEKYHNLITWFISTLIGIYLTFLLVKKIKNTELKIYLQLYLFKFSPFIGIIPLCGTYQEFFATDLVNILPFITLYIFFSIFVIWGIIKFLNENNYFKNRYFFLFLYSFPILIFLLDKL